MKRTAFILNLVVILILLLAACTPGAPSQYRGLRSPVDYRLVE